MGEKKVVFISCNRLGWRTFALCLKEADDANLCDHRNVVRDSHDGLKNQIFFYVNKVSKMIVGFLPAFFRVRIVGWVRSRRRSLDLRQNLASGYSSQHHHWFGHNLFDLKTIPSDLSFSVSIDCSALQRFEDFDDVYLSKSSRRFKLIKKEELGLLLRAKFIHTSSDWVANYLVSNYSIEPEKLLNRNLPLIDSVTDFPEEILAKGDWLTFIGQDFKRKGGDFLLDLHQKYFCDYIPLHIVGVDQPKHQSYKNVIWHGWVPNSEVRNTILPNTRVFVMPTLVDMSPNVCVEALAHGVPSVVTKVGAIDELITHLETGFVLDRDEYQFFEAINMLYEDDKLYEQMALSSKEFYACKLKKNNAAELIVERCLECVKQL